MKKLIIRADGNSQIGTGHFMRCLSLAQYWKNEVGEVYFIMIPNQVLEERIKNENMNFIPMHEVPGSMEDVLKLVKVNKELNGNWIVLDGYHFSSDYQKVIKDNQINLLFIDDDGKLNHYYSDIILNQNLHGEELQYLNKENYTKLLLGTDYVLLREEFFKYLNYKKEIKEVKNILVTLGGSDINNFTLKVVKSIFNLNNFNNSMFDYDNLHIKVIIGSNNPNKSLIEKYLTENNVLNIEIIQNSLNMADLMFWADLVFSSGGTTVWEIAFMGIPGIISGIAENQFSSIKKLNQMSLFKTINCIKNIDENEISKMIIDIILDKNIRQKMSMLQQSLINGKGCESVVNEILSFK
ncbi:MAG: UDP-2,4-diacetamido-2,4,6-trideoxy-beta-L-altropyranose hydrolase [Methanobrevibacter sp.]|jgi:UDP-2,4-diacetamido-2,4,6-trideoxy-beta-L-altropyranose hydrolase|nr:UDP-2,4-diacetamido-2,4,6-trideoxy-beta-L-altropyranose hydrolase [Methanobrevibacter sp.]